MLQSATQHMVRLQVHKQLRARLQQVQVHQWMSQVVSGVLPNAPEADVAAPVLL